MVTTGSLTQTQPELSSARAYLGQLASVLDAPGSAREFQANMLARLRTDLLAAIGAYESACERGAPFEVCLSLKSDLLWLCNQCGYYLSRSEAQSENQLAQPVQPFSAAIAFQHSHRQNRLHRGLWQIRAVVWAIAQFKLLTYIRSLLLRRPSVSLAWRDILPGIRLWLPGSRGRH